MARAIFSWSLLAGAVASLLSYAFGPALEAVGGLLGLLAGLVLLTMLAGRLATRLRQLVDGRRRATPVSEPAGTEVVAEFGPVLRAGRLVGLVAVANFPDGEARSVVLGGPARLGATTVVEAGSVTKGVTGLVLASLVLDGVVALDDDAGALLGVATLRGISLEDLATHRSGLPRLPASLVWRALLAHPDPYRGVDREQLLSSVPSPDADRWPRYSNLGFALLGAALEEATGRPFRELAEAIVLEPLGMVGSSFRARLGVRGRDRWCLPTPSWHFDAYTPAGGLRATALDLARLAGALAAPPPGRLGDAIELAVRPRRAFGGSRSIGLGWLSEDGAVFHNGGTAGFWSWVGADRARGVSLAVVAPSAPDSRFDVAARRALSGLEELAQGSR